MADTSVASLAFQALGLCRQGRTADGVNLYRQALASAGGLSLPVGLHSRLLEDSGHQAAAAEIRRAGRLAGADLSTSPLQRGQTPRVAVQEYRALFAAGHVNAQMVANYMVALSLAGESSLLADVASPSILLQQRTLQYFARDGAAAARVSKRLITTATREHQPAVKSIRGMDRVPATHTIDDPDLRAIHDEVAAHVRDYQGVVRSSGHWIGQHLPDDFTVRSWAVISDGRGHNVPHLHPGCWVVAVLYLALEHAAADAADAGVLRIGPGIGGSDRCDGWPRVDIAPIPGTLVLMPAYYTHSTVPLHTAGLRISMAFNASRLVDDSDPDSAVSRAHASV